MASRSNGALSDKDDHVDIEDANDPRHHNKKETKDNKLLELGWMFIPVTIFLEIMVMTFDQMASPMEPQYALVVWGLTTAAMFVCLCDLIYKGLIKEKMTLLQCLKSLLPCSSSSSSANKKPYSFMDGMILLGAKVQTVFASISYGYLHQGKENPIKVSFVALIFIVCFVLVKFVKNRKEAHHLPVRA